MGKLHTDREILRCIFDMYRCDYPAKGDPFLAVDLFAIARKLGCPPELLFGRLRYDMGTRLRHRDPNDTSLTLASIFEQQLGDQRHVVNFPYLVAVLASLEEQRGRHMWTAWLSIGAIVVAVCSAAIQWATAGGAVSTVAVSPAAHPGGTMPPAVGVCYDAVLADLSAGARQARARSRVNRSTVAPAR